MGFVVGDEHGAFAAPLVNLGGVTGAARSGGGGRHLGGEEDPESGAPARLAVDGDGAPMTAHDAEHGGEAEAASGELGGEEGIEDAFLGGGVHAAAGVLDLEVDVGAFGERLLASEAEGLDGLVERRAVAVLDARGDKNAAVLVAESVGGVDDQVHDHLADLGDIALETGEVIGQAALEARSFGHGDLEQMCHLPGQNREVDLVEDELALAGVGEHLAGEFGGAAGRFDDLENAAAGGG